MEHCRPRFYMTIGHEPSRVSTKSRKLRAYCIDSDFCKIHELTSKVLLDTEKELNQVLNIA